MTDNAGIKIVLIPAYQPDNILIELVNNLKSKEFEIVVVNDGSDLGCDTIFMEVSKIAKVISYRENKGKGFALKEGLRYIRDNFSGEYTVVTMDADGQHSIEDGLKISEEAQMKKRTLILGSRLQSSSSPLRSRIGNSITRKVYKLTTGLSVYDTQTGLRAFDNNLIDFFIDIEGNRYEYEMNVLLESSKNKIPIKEIPIETIYIDGNSNSHFDSVKDSIRIYKEILKFALSSFAGFIVDYIVFTLMLILTTSMPHVSITISNIVARIVSASVNFTINYKFVFKKGVGVVSSVTKYIIMAVLILVGNTFVLNFITSHFSINPLLAKIVTEIIFFIINLIAQKFFVFKPKKQKTPVLHN